MYTHLHIEFEDRLNYKTLFPALVNGSRKIINLRSAWITQQVTIEGWQREGERVSRWVGK